MFELLCHILTSVKSVQLKNWFRRWQLSCGTEPVMDADNVANHLLFNGYRGLLPRVVKLITHVHLAQRLRTRGDIPSLPHTFLWRGV